MRLSYALCLAFISFLLYHFLPNLNVKEENVALFKEDGEFTKFKTRKKPKRKPVMSQSTDEGWDVEESLFSWIRKQGGYINPKVSLLNEPDAMGTIRGVAAREKIEQDEEIAVIPKTVMMCVKPEETECELTVMLVGELELGNRSFYWPYLRLLGLHRPILFTIEEELLLAGLPPYEFNQVDDHFPKCGFDSGDLVWRGVMAMLWARVKYVDSELCLVPFWDSFNYGRATNVVSETTQKIKLRAHADIVEGAELWNDHDYATPELFTFHGIVEDFPNTWFFDGDDGVRYTFDVDQDLVGVVHSEDGVPPDMQAMKTQLHRTYQTITEGESAFEAACDAYAGPVELLEHIKTYRVSYIYALELAMAALDEGL